MFCPNCGKQIPNDSKFCMSCGKSTSATNSGPIVKEVCTIEFTGTRPSFLWDLATTLPFVGFLQPGITCWYEALIADKVIAKSPTFRGRYDSPHFSGENETVRKTFIDGLQAEGWEPIIDARSGRIHAMERIVR